ncbi:MAG: YbhB/YbcL family Raf kinase inhibitor-like protein, partial [Anaerolineales bacterium]
LAVMIAGCAAHDPASTPVSARTDPEAEALEPSSADSASSLTLMSEAFENGGPIPSKFTCDGADISPELQWEQAPPGTQTYVLIMDDPDAPAGTWVHWVLYNIPAEARAIDADVMDASDLPGGTQTGLNSWGEASYGGPCPPSGEHRYFFVLYALDTQFDLEGDVTSETLRSAITGHVLTQAELMGTYSR